MEWLFLSKILINDGLFGTDSWELSLFSGNAPDIQSKIVSPRCINFATSLGKVLEEVASWENPNLVFSQISDLKPPKTAILSICIVYGSIQLGKESRY